MSKMIFAILLTASVAFGADDIQTLTQQCEANNGKACHALGYNYDFGEGVTKDVNLAIKYYEKACNLKFSCNNLANIYYEGKGVARNEAKAAEYYAKGCDLGDGSNCGSAGAHYLANTQRFLTAKKYLEKGCNLKDGTSCHNLGVLYATGQGVKADMVMAKRYYRKACNELGFKASCRHAK